MRHPQYAAAVYAAIARCRNEAQRQAIHEAALTIRDAIAAAAADYSFPSYADRGFEANTAARVALPMFDEFLEAAARARIDADVADEEEHSYRPAAAGWEAARANRALRNMPRTGA